MKIIKRRFFLKRISYLLFGIASFFTLNEYKKPENFLVTFLNKINNSKIDSLINIGKLKKNNYTAHKKFILDYKSKNFHSFNDFSDWLNKRIKSDYSNSNLSLLDNIFVSETEVSLLIAKYS